MLNARGVPFQIADTLEAFEQWSRWWFDDAEERVLEWTRLPSGVHVSTMFLGVAVPSLALDLFEPARAPILWQTTVLNGPHHGKGRRYTSPEDAMHGHQWWVQIASAESPSPVHAVDPLPL